MLTFKNLGGRKMKRSSVLTLGILVIFLGLVPQVWGTAGVPFNINTVTTGQITVDGNLQEWANAQWATDNITYTVGHEPTDITAGTAQVAYAWDSATSKLYVAVKVQDNFHFLMDDYTTNTQWNARDGIEIYVHTTGGPATTYQLTSDVAQCYCVGIKNSDGAQVWKRFGQAQAIPDNCSFVAAGRTGLDGWLYYEAEITPWVSYGGILVPPGNNTANTLTAGMDVGLDVVVVTKTATDYGALTENNPLMSGKYNDWTKFATHTLISAAMLPPTGPTPTLEPTPTVTPTPTIAPGALLNGSFESPVQTGNPTGKGWNVPAVLDNWTQTSTANYFLGVWNNPSPAVITNAVDGVQFIQVYYGMEIWQNTRYSIRTGNTYTLKFQEATTAADTGTKYAAAGFYAATNQTTVGSAAYYPIFYTGLPTLNVWLNRSVSWTADAANNGKFLVARIKGGNTAYRFYDNVTLTVGTPVTGTVILGDYDPVDHNVPIGIQLQLLKTDGTVVQTVHQVLTGTGGPFTMPNVPTGNYILTLKSYMHNKKAVAVTIAANPLPVDVGTIELDNGDLHGDNEIDSTGLAIILDGLGTPGDAWPDPNTP
jgi:hypothetical protein